MKKNVLVIADMKENNVLSLEKARYITTYFDCNIEIIKFINNIDSSKTAPSQLISDAEDILSSTIDNVFDDTTEIIYEVVITENIADWVVERCTQKSIDLVIKEGHRTEALFHTPTDWQLIRHLTCPILIASHEKWKSQANILLTIDLSHDDDNHNALNDLILTWGYSYSTLTHTQLNAMYSIPISKPLLEFDVVDKDLVIESKGPAAKQKMQSLLNRFDMSAITSHITAGPPDRTIPHMANELHSDLVIIGCVGREGLGGFILGNTAEKVLHHLRTDCLIIKREQV
ncbi:hypothetical protein CJF42_17930 [Pseudoalteromonas sp. NBT06-2]|uniref:universal stress protein n=1 Tax=Pseudoalteromonas sp. NBT06-2 TaxID=2025950 RepID=UPI000BA5D29F|nr:universal stress protein [Pseudoalteromonas sp. NBT06-2]PAJ73044.1 hypothetical protein CJF42_17930 [Pseudoalteromonas sp. NBT06-2]